MRVADIGYRRHVGEESSVTIFPAFTGGFIDVGDLGEDGVLVVDRNVQVVFKVDGAIDGAL
jgi:hypothetical protein